MSTLLTKNLLKSLLVNISLNYVEPYDANVALTWSQTWASYFQMSSLDSTTSYNPSYITDMATYLKVGVNTITGAGDSTGTSISIMCNLTNETGIFLSSFFSDNYIETDDLLGQSSVSTLVGDYTIVSQLSPTNISVLTSVMSSAMVGITSDGSFAGKLSDGIEAWWSEMESNPSDYFPSATAVTKPSGILSGLENTIQSAIDYNNDYIELNGNISKEDAMDKLADVIHTANSGGTATIGGSDYTIG